MEWVFFFFLKKMVVKWGWTIRLTVHRKKLISGSWGKNIITPKSFGPYPFEPRSPNCIKIL
jgi:hypothetical protein